MPRFWGEEVLGPSERLKEGQYGRKIGSFWGEAATGGSRAAGLVMQGLEPGKGFEAHPGKEE